MLFKIKTALGRDSFQYFLNNFFTVSHNDVNFLDYDVLSFCHSKVPKVYGELANKNICCSIIFKFQNLKSE